MNRWTEQETATARDMWTQGVTAKAIAETLGRSTNSVIGRINFIGLQKRERQTHLGRGRASKVAARDRTAEANRTYREPCFRCGVRADVGCKHRRVV